MMLQRQELNETVIQYIAEEHEVWIHTQEWSE